MVRISYLRFLFFFFFLFLYEFQVVVLFYCNMLIFQILNEYHGRGKMLHTQQIKYSGSTFKYKATWKFKAAHVQYPEDSSYCVVQTKRL